MRKDDPLKVLANGRDFWMVNWNLVQFINDPANGLKTKTKGSEGLEEAVILSYLCSKQNYWAGKDRLTADGFFYNSINTMQKDTSIEPRKQRKALHTLKTMGLIEMKPIREKGVETKRYFRVNTENLARSLGVKRA